MNSPRTRLYRDKAEGKLLGVCAGIGDYVGVDPVWIRVGFVIATLFQGWPAIVYLAIGFLAPAKPSHLYADAPERRFWQGVRQSPGRSTREIRARFRDIDRRLARVEEFHVDENRALAAEIEKLR